MSGLTVNSRHIALMLARDCFGYNPPVRVGRERSSKSPDDQYAKIKAAKEKRLKRQLRNITLQEGQ